MKYTHLFFCFVLSLSSLECWEETCISGTVQNCKTDAPVSGARIHFTYHVSDPSYLSSREVVEESNAAGEFSCCTANKGYDLYMTNVFKEGYSDTFSFSDGFLKLLPYDGFFILNIFNETGTHDSLIVSVFNKCEYTCLQRFGKHGTFPNVLNLQKGEMHTESFACCAGDSANVQWKFSRFGPATEIDSLWLNMNDTTVFNLKY